MKDSTMLSVYIMGMFFLLVNWDIVVMKDNFIINWIVILFLLSAVGTAFIYLLYNSIIFIKKCRKEDLGVKQ